jgi:HEAT repeat protein
VRVVSLEAMDACLEAPPWPLRVYGWDAPTIDHEALGSYREAVEIAFPVLLKAVRDSDPIVRAAARAALGSVTIRPAMNPEPAIQHAVEALAVLLEDGDAIERATAARALGGIGPAAAPAVPALIEVLRRPELPADGEHDSSPSEAATALGRIGPEAAPAIPELLGWVRADSTAETAISALGVMGVKDARVIEVLLGILRDDGYPAIFQHALAAQALVRLDAHVDEAILHLVAEAARGKTRPGSVVGRAGDKIGAAETLLAYRQAAAALVRAGLAATDSWGPEGAGVGISMLETERVAEAVDLLRGETARARNAGDTVTLERIARVAAGMGPRGAPLVADLVPLPHDGDTLREAVALAIVRTGESSPAAAEWLASCLRHGPLNLRAAILRELVRAAAQGILAAWDLGAGPLADAVKAAATDPDPELRDDARQILEWMAPTEKGPGTKDDPAALLRALQRGNAWALRAAEELGPRASDVLPALLEFWLHCEPGYWDRLVQRRRAVNAIMAVEPDGRRLKAQIPWLREALLAR